MQADFLAVFLTAMKKRISLKDIAERVGVSTALVSYVLNDQEEEKRVGKEIAKRIREVAAELDYGNSHVAKSATIHSNSTIAFLVADIGDQYTTEVMRSIEAECQLLNYTVIYASSDENNVKFEDQINSLVSRQVDGIILVALEDSEPQIRFLEEKSIPFVLIDRMITDLEVNIIGIDNFKLARKLTNHIIKTGHKRIGLITDETSLMHLLDRTEGYRAALAAAGHLIDPAMIKKIASGNRAVEVSAAIDGLLLLDPPCDALFFATGTLAIAGLRHIKARKIQVPETLGVVSYDASEMFDLFYCDITHGIQPLEEIGRMAVNTLKDVITPRKVRRKVLLETGFYIGNSCNEEIDGLPKTSPDKISIK